MKSDTDEVISHQNQYQPGMQNLAEPHKQLRRERVGPTSGKRPDPENLEGRVASLVAVVSLQRVVSKISGPKFSRYMVIRE